MSAVLDASAGAGAGNYFQTDSPPVSGSVIPCTFCCWVKRTATTNTDRMMAILQASAAGPNISIILADSGNTARLYTQTSAGSDYFADSGTPNTSWHFFACILVSATSRKLVYDTTITAGSATSLNVASIDRLIIGGQNQTGYSSGMTGNIAEAAVWTGDQTAILAGLASGKSPMFYRTGLVGYWPLISNSTPRIGPALTAVNSPTFDAAVHPTIQYPGVGAIAQLLLDDD